MKNMIFVQQMICGHTKATPTRIGRSHDAAFTNRGLLYQRKKHQKVQDNATFSEQRQISGSPWSGFELLRIQILGFLGCHP